MGIYLSVVIPCYNEKENLERGVLSEVDEWLKKQNFDYEVVVSDDASTDISRKLVKEFIKSHKKFRLLENKHGGKSWALKYGLDAAKGELVLFTDMDLSTPFSELSKLIDQIDKGGDVVIGSRGKLRDNFSQLRKVASNAFRVFRKSLLLHNIDDTQCGFKLVRTKIAKRLFNKMKIFKLQPKARGWVVAAWDVEFLFLSEKFNYRLIEVPVLWSDKDESTGKDRNMFKFVTESLDMLKQVLRVKLNDIRGEYEND